MPIAALAVALACAALTLAGPGRAAAGGTDGAKPTIVLVHGAWADGSSWDAVIARLRRQGYPVLAPATPLRGLASDSAYIASVLAALKGPIVLVGHAYGGEVISNAARGNPNVKALVYVAGIAPDRGETGLGLLGKFPGSTLSDTLVSFPLPGGGTDLYIAQAKYRQQFAADVPAARAALMAVTQRPITQAAAAEPSGAPAWKEIPSWFVFGSADRNIPPAVQRLMAGRAKAKRTVELEGASHAIPVSRPDAVADLIVEAATSR
jgi:pimeloyl-ACP methyl ester carboxylesterase